jgi:hypothetical protein
MSAPKWFIWRIEPAAIWNKGQGQALVLNIGNATLKIFDEAVTADRWNGRNRLGAD